MLIKKEAFAMVLVLSLFLVAGSVNAECPDGFPCTTGEGCSGVCKDNLCEDIADDGCPEDSESQTIPASGDLDFDGSAAVHLEVPEGPSRLNIIKVKISNVFSKLGDADKYIYFGGGFFVFILIVAVVLFAIFRKGGTEPEEIDLDKVYFKFPSEKTEEIKLSK